ncbi:MAG: fumarylacetoacetate hydrolase family protein [Kistimonas sp.]|nr:fumarylacetoacetate hydrolase family protein [Kistimonas sp.]
MTNIKNIYCVGRNYTDHARELGNSPEGEPIVFSKPTSSLAQSGVVRLPRLLENIQFETELVIKVDKTCSGVSESFASQAFQQIAVGLDLTARSLQKELSAKGLPWLLAKGFDNACYVAPFVTKPAHMDDVCFSMHINGDLAQRGRVTDMLFSIPRILSFISRYITLYPGDIVFTGTPSGVGELSSGDQLELCLEGLCVDSVSVV